MSELLTAKDVEVKIFKKARFGGYSVAEVEDFLNQIADDLEAYVIQIDEKDARIAELEARVRKHDEMTDAIKDTLIRARQAAKEMEDKAQSEHDAVIAEAQAQAQKLLSESEAKSRALIDDAEKKSTDIIAEARTSATEILQAEKDKRAKAEGIRANIEQEIETIRKQAEDQAQDILEEARAASRRLMAETQQEASDYQQQIQFLSLKKQQFLKDTVSILLDFGKIIENAQEDLNVFQEENKLENQNSEEIINPVNGTNEN